METICSSETSVETQRTTRRHIPEDDTLQPNNKIWDFLGGENMYRGLLELDIM
jgi:hypothetical protein